MVTNINLSSPGAEKKPALTGKSTLILSIFLLVATVIVYSALYITKSKNTKDNELILSEIKQKKQDLSGSNYVEIADFQERVSMLNKIVSDRFSWRSFIVEFSKYVLPEIKVEAFNPGETSLPISGTAPSYEAVIREINLLKKFSAADSVELLSVSESITESGQQSKINFRAELKLNKKKFMENNSSNQEKNDQ